MFQVFSRCIGQKRPHQSAGNFSQIQRSKAEREFHLYPVCLALTFLFMFYAKKSPSMPDLSACYECARLWSPIEHAFHLKHRACARGMSIESIFI